MYFRWVVILKMKQLFYLALLLFASSCQFFETEKISSETFYEEDLKAIDWEDVDQYPAFPECISFTEKWEKKHCFEETLQKYVSRSIGSKKMSTHTELHDTVLLEFSINRTGKISILNITMDSTLVRQLPSLRQWLAESIDSLPTLEPANKQGVPVETQFTFPVVIRTEGTTN